MENKTRKYLAAACFGIIAILDIVDLVDYFYIGGLIFPIGSVLVVVSLLASMPVLSAAAFALRTVVSLFSCVGYFVVVQYGAISKLFLFVWGVAAIGDFLLMIASINPKSAKTLCTIATILLIIRLIALVAINVSDGHGITFMPILEGLLLAASAMLLGLTYDGVAKKKITPKVDTLPNSSGGINSPAKAVIEDRNIDKLMRLKAFLDEGIITQEEFDEKKKQLLRM